MVRTPGDWKVPEQLAAPLARERRGAHDGGAVRERHCPGRRRTVRVGGRHSPVAVKVIGSPTTASEVETVSDVPLERPAHRHPAWPRGRERRTNHRSRRPSPSRIPVHGRSRAGRRRKG